MKVDKFYSKNGKRFAEVETSYAAGFGARKRTTLTLTKRNKHRESTTVTGYSRRADAMKAAREFVA